jgi:hypothetical protein
MTIISTDTAPAIDLEASAREFAEFQNNFQLILDNEMPSYKSQNIFSASQHLVTGFDTLFAELSR